MWMNRDYSILAVSQLELQIATGNNWGMVDLYDGSLYLA